MLGWGLWYTISISCDTSFVHVLQGRDAVGYDLLALYPAVSLQSYRDTSRAR
jgi:hypothetical protein